MIVLWNLCHCYEPVVFTYGLRLVHKEIIVCPERMLCYLLRLKLSFKWTMKSYSKYSEQLTILICSPFLVMLCWNYITCFSTFVNVIQRMTFSTPCLEGGPHHLHPSEWAMTWNVPLPAQWALPLQTQLKQVRGLPFTWFTFGFSHTVLWYLLSTPKGK